MTLSGVTLADIATYRTNPNTKGSTANYRKPKGNSNQCSYKGPPPDDYDYLKMLAGTTAAQNIYDFLQAQLPGPPPVSLGGALGALFSTLMNNFRK